MGIEKPTEVVKKLDKLYDEKNRGQTAEAVLRILDPLMEERLGSLLAEFGRCLSELGPLLDLRARITEIWRIRRALRDGVKLGKSAEGLLETVMEKISVREPDNK